MAQPTTAFVVLHENSARPGNGIRSQQVVPFAKRESLAPLSREQPSLDPRFRSFRDARIALESLFDDRRNLKEAAVGVFMALCAKARIDD